MSETLKPRMRRSQISRMVNLLQTPHFYEDPRLKNEFHKLASKYLCTLAAILDLDDADYEIRSNKAGPAVSGEVTLHTTKFYLQIAQCSLACQILYRKCNGMKDYAGGMNQWAKWEDLRDVDAFAKRLRPLLGR